ncbi:MAG: hypothetical protein KAJ63_11280 [Methyloprofundus sp.]|nr:hypothetical protein [Methyloprofundus sp.]
MVTKHKNEHTNNHSELTRKVQELVEFVENAYQDGRAAHEVEEGLFRKVLEIGRYALALFFDLSGDGDEGEWIELAEGRKVWRLKNLHKKAYQSIFGFFTLCRAVYGTREKQRIEWIPLDARLSLPESRFSYLLQDWDQYLISDGPFAKVSDTIQKILGFTQSVNSLERTNRQMSESVEAFWTTKKAPAAEEEGALMVCQADCKGVVMRTEDDKKTAEQDPLVQTPASNKQDPCNAGKKGKKKMALIGAAYTVDPYIRSPEDVLNALFREMKKNNESLPARPSPQFKHVRGALLRDDQGTMQPSYDKIFGWLAQEIEQRNPEGEKPMPVIMDGQDSLWAALPKYFPGVNLIQVLDIIHVTSYVWDATHLFYKKGSEKAFGFAKQRILRILKGEVDRVIRGLRWLGTHQKLSEKKLESLERIWVF